MLTVDMILKKAMKGEMDLMGPAMEVASELTGIPDFSPPSTDVYERHLAYIKNFKKAVLMVAGSAAQKLMMTLAKEQEILMSIADMMNWTYCAESTVLRVQKIHNAKGEEAAALALDAMQTYVYTVADKINVAGKDALVGFSEGDELKMMMIGMKRFTKVEPFNCKEARRRVAEACLEKNDYCF
jgi:hypothetical protein